MRHITPANRFFLAAQAGALFVLILFITDLYLNRQTQLNEGLEKTRRFNAMMAEHTARTFDAVDILLREISGELIRSQPDWRLWHESDGWNYLAQRQSRSMPQLHSLKLFDENGALRHQSTPPDSALRQIGKESYFTAVAGGKKISRAGPFFDERAQQFVYTLGHRIVDPQGKFAGLAQGTIDPLYLQEFCWPNRLTEEFEAVLTNAAGEIIASCRPSNQGRSSELLGRFAETVLFNGELSGQIQESGTFHRGDFIISMTHIPGFPEIRMLTAVPQNSLLLGWRKRMQELSLLALMVVGIILTGGLLIRLQLLKLGNMTKELEASHAVMERRVEAATEELAKQLGNAELANIAKSRFLAAASHDLRQPMHALSLFATDLQSQARTGNYRELPRLAEQIGASTRLLSDLLDSLLDISRMDVSGISASVRSFPLQKIFERLHTAHRRAAGEKTQVLRFRATPLWLSSDPDLLERLLGNLVSNALRYTPRNGRILILARKRGDQVVIEVRDNGIGIAQENQAAIFTEFYQVANAAREQHQGLGLGLSIVDRLARALDIEVRLRSAPNRGTTFMLTVQGAALQSERPMPAAPQAAPNLLYVIGDSPDTMAAAKLAENWDYQVMYLTIDSPVPANLPGKPLILTEQALASSVRERWPGNLMLVALAPAEKPEGAPEALPEGIHLYPLPIRPAKLRALLAQLQNTSSKSIP